MGVARPPRTQVAVLPAVVIHGELVPDYEKRRGLSSLQRALLPGAAAAADAAAVLVGPEVGGEGRAGWRVGEVVVSVDAALGVDVVVGRRRGGRFPLEAGFCRTAPSTAEELQQFSAEFCACQKTKQEKR